MIWLICGCCGDSFQGDQGPEQDTGYGTCLACEALNERDNEDRWADLERKVAAALNNENRKKFQGFDKAKQRRVMVRLIDKGVIVWRIGT